MSAQQPVRVLICEDSRTYSHALRRFLEEGDDLHVVGTCATAEELLSSLSRLRPDLVTMDLELPGMNGLEATKRIMRSRPLPILVLSAYTGRGSERAAAALAAGALEVLPKAELRLDGAMSAPAVALRRRIRRLAAARVERRDATGVAQPPAPTRGSTGRAATAVGIVASTGGPPVLGAILGALPADFPLPVLVVQHIAIGFTEGLARWLDSSVDAPVGLAADRQPAGPGIWIAPDDTHLELDPRMRIRLDRERVVGRHRPSADVLLGSMAAASGDGTVAVVLTGMGRDGAAGVGAVRIAGGLTIAQDGETAAVNGMPAAAVKAGAELVLRPEEIAATLRALRPGLVTA
jgi:two-component system chemotaxis response regulator CheB